MVFPLALIIESPIIMLLSASVALSKDWASYRLVRTYMMVAGASLTALHTLIVFTPLYYVVVRGILGAPEAIVEPARIGLAIMLPWTWTIAYRRFNQGVLIRFGHSRAVGAGTIVRLSADLIVLAAGLAIGTVPGIVVATLAVASGVTSEAIFAGIRVQPVLRNELAVAPVVKPPLTWPAFFVFYFPLVLTSLLGLIAQPMGSAALSRMPDPLSSLAVWPVVTGLVFMVRGLGIAFNEVVVALLDEPGARPVLRRFTLHPQRGNDRDPPPAGCNASQLLVVCRRVGPAGRPRRYGSRGNLAGAAHAGAQHLVKLVPGPTAAQPPHARHHRVGRHLSRSEHRNPGRGRRVRGVHRSVRRDRRAGAGDGGPNRVAVGAGAGRGQA